MEESWLNQFRMRMRSFELRRAPREGELPVSIKVRVASGCFHREHSPRAYEFIDSHVASMPPSDLSELALIEHESGPELLVYLALGTAGATLARSVIDLVVAIIKARADGVKNGDRPDYPVELIVRKSGEGDKLLEETVTRFGTNDPINGAQIEKQIKGAIKKIQAKSPEKQANKVKSKRPNRRKS